MSLTTFLFRVVQFFNPLGSWGVSYGHFFPLFEFFAQEEVDAVLDDVLEALEREGQALDIAKEALERTGRALEREGRALWVSNLATNKLLKTIKGDVGRDLCGSGKPRLRRLHLLQELQLKQCCELQCSLFLFHDKSIASSIMFRVYYQS